MSDDDHADAEGVGAGSVTVTFNVPPEPEEMLSPGSLGSRHGTSRAGETALSPTHLPSPRRTNYAR